MLKSEAEERLTIEIGGQEEGREMRSCTLELPPRTRVEIENGFFSLSYVPHQIPTRARGSGSTSPVRKETHLIGMQDWGNIWVYGRDVLLAGYMAREEFSRRASFIQAGTRVFQYDETHVKNLAVPVSDLKPLSELFERVKAWYRKRQLNALTGIKEAMKIKRIVLDFWSYPCWRATL